MKKKSSSKLNNLNIKQVKSTQRKSVSNEEESAIKKIARTINEQMEEEKKSFFEIPFFRDSKTFSLLLYCLQKNIKTSSDILFISHYLSSYQSIINLTDKKKTFIDSSKILYELSNRINLEKKQSKSIICRYGDNGEKFYFILKGSVSVIIKKEIKIRMTEYEYYSYLLNLKNYSEKELIEENLRINNIHYDSVDMKNYIEGVFNYETPYDEKKIEYPLIDIEQLNFCSCDEYIERILPIINKETEKAKKKLNLCVYFNVINLKEGETFGDIALNKNYKRTATIICNEDCVFGTLTKKCYEICIKGALEKIRTNNLNFLVNCDLFNGIKPETFDKKYFNYFKIIYLTQGNFLFKQGDKRKEIYILKDGLIEIYIKNSYKELINLINSKNIKIDENMEKRELKMINLPIENLLTNQKIFKIVKIGENEILGLDDYIDKKNLFHCSAICKSNFLEIFSIDYKIFCDICERDWKINENVINFNKNRCDIMFNRILEIRNIALNKDLINIQKESEEKIKQMEIEIINNNKKKFLFNTVYASKKFRNIIKNKERRNKDNKLRYFLNVYNKTNSLTDNNNHFNSEDFTNENTIQLSEKKVNQKLNINSLSMSKSHSSIKKIKDTLFKNHETYNLINKELTTKRILIPIQPLLKNEYSQKKLKEFKMKLISSTTIVHSQEKEKNIIDKIFNRALFRKIGNLNEKKLKKMHKKINSVDQVNFLIMDNIMEKFLPNKKNNFNIKRQRIPLNFKNHSPYLIRSNTKIYEQS